jgi:hypothetical protein
MKNSILLRKLISMDFYKVVIVEINDINAFGDCAFGIMEMPQNKKLLKNVDKKQFKKIYEYIGHRSYGKTMYGLFLFETVLVEYYNKYKDQFNKAENQLYKIFFDNELMTLTPSGKATNPNPFDVVVVNKAYCKQKKVRPRDIIYHEISHFVYFFDSKLEKMTKQAFKKLEKRYRDNVIGYLTITKAYQKEQIHYEWLANLVDNDAGMKEIYRFSKPSQLTKKLIKELKSYTEDYIDLVLNFEEYKNAAKKCENSENGG